MKNDEKPKSAILRVAAELFSERGFALTSVRTIAKEAGVDPTLVIRHFGSKEALFLEVANFEDSVRQFGHGPLETLGDRIVDSVLSIDDRALNVYAALIRASDSVEVQERLREANRRLFVDRLAPKLLGDDRELRARLVGALVGGLLNIIRVQGDDTVRDADRTVLRSLYGRAVQTLIDGEPDAVVGRAD